MNSTPQQFVDRVHEAVSNGMGEAARGMMDEVATRETASLPLRRAAGLLLVQYGHYGEPALSCMETVAALQPNDPQVLRALATLRWIRDQRVAGATPALDAARRLVALVPDDGPALSLLGWVALSARQYKESYRAFTAAVATRQLATSLAPQLRLVDTLMRGGDRVAFTLDGVTYNFGLAVHTTQATESSIVHCSGWLTEMEELRYLKSALEQADVIVEVGVLLGNHSVFFLQNLAPKRLHLFEVDPSMLPEIRRNTDANNRYGTEIFLHQAFIGADGGEPFHVAGVPVPQRSLSGMVPERVDFLKVDTDGGELPFLAGAEELIVTSRPFVMMETDTVTDAPVQEWFAARGYVRRHRIEHGHYFNNFFAYGE